MKKLISLVLVVLVCSTADAEIMLTTGKCNIRRGPDIDSKVIGTIDAGEYIDVVDYFESEDGRYWAKTYCRTPNGGEIFGYVSDKNLEYTDELDFGCVEMITTGDVNVRLWADIDGPINAVYPKDTYVYPEAFYPTDDGRVWAQIDIGGYYGKAFISTKYLKFTNSSLELQQYMRVTGESVNVRREPSIYSHIQGYLHYGDVVEVVYYEVMYDGCIWAYVIHDNEEVDCVSVKYLQKVQ